MKTAPELFLKAERGGVKLSRTASDVVEIGIARQAILVDDVGSPDLSSTGYADMSSCWWNAVKSAAWPRPVWLASCPSRSQACRMPKPPSNGPWRCCAMLGPTPCRSWLSRQASDNAAFLLKHSETSRPRHTVSHVLDEHVWDAGLSVLLLSERSILGGGIIDFLAVNAANLHLLGVLPGSTSENRWALVCSKTPWAGIGKHE